MIGSKLIDKVIAIITRLRLLLWFTLYVTKLIFQSVHSFRLNLLTAVRFMYDSIALLMHTQISVFARK